MPDMFYVYIIYSSRIDKYYVGSTNDVLRRLNDHNRGKNNYSKNGMPWELKYFESFISRDLAFRRELEIKNKKSRKYIEYLISTGSEHPGI